MICKFIVIIIRCPILDCLTEPTVSRGGRPSMNSNINKSLYPVR